MMTNRRKRSPKGFTLRALFMANLLIAFALLLVNVISSFAISETTYDSIKLGMTRAEVVQLAGKPHLQNENGSFYRVWNGLVTYSDLLNVHYNDRDQVDHLSF